MQNTNVENNFFQFLTEQNIPNTVVTNGIYNKKQDKLYPKINTLKIEEAIEKIKEKNQNMKKVGWKEKLKRKLHF